MKQKMKKRQKMHRTNYKIRQFMKKDNFKDIYLFPHSRFSKDYHFQNLSFDGIASKNSQLVLFQCKTNCKASKKIMEKYREVSKKFNILCLWFNCIDRKGVQCQQ